MIEQLAVALQRFTERQRSEGPYLTAIEGVGILRSDHPKPPIHMISRPSMCIVAQGAKRAGFGDTTLQYSAGQALIVGVDTPSVGRVFEASPDMPCLVLAIELDLGVLRAIAERLTPPPKVGARLGLGATVVEVGGAMADCALRLVRLLDMPDAIPVLAPLILQELCYWLLTGSEGGEVLRLALANPSRGVIAALHMLRLNYRQPIRINDLAEIAQTSPSVFHRQFKTLTSLSPLQYAKQLRLLEARRLLTTCNVNAETAAYTVGYESASQFSREYARKFGAPPRREVQRMLSSIAA